MRMLPVGGGGKRSCRNTGRRRCSPRVFGQRLHAARKPIPLLGPTACVVRSAGGIRGRDVARIFSVAILGGLRRSQRHRACFDGKVELLKEILAHLIPEERPQPILGARNFRFLQLLYVELDKLLYDPRDGCEADELRRPCGCGIRAAVKEATEKPILRSRSVEKPRSTMAEIPASSTETGTATAQRITNEFSAMKEVDEEEGMVMLLFIRTNNGEARVTGTRIRLREDGLNVGVLDRPIRQTDPEREALHDARSRSIDPIAQDSPFKVGGDVDIGPPSENENPAGFPASFSGKTRENLLGF